MMSPMTTKIYACVVHDKRTLSLLKVFFHRFSGGREKKRVFVNVFHTNKVFRLDARPENDKTKRAFLCCVKKKDAKKREREIHFFPVVVRFTDSFSPTFQIAPCPCLWTRTVVKSPSPFPPQTKKKKQKKNTKNWTVLVKQHQDENVRWKRRLKTKKKHFFVVFIYRKKKRKTTLTDETRPIPISLSNNNNY